MAAQGAQPALPADIPSFTKEKDALSALRTGASNRDERFIVQSPYVDTEHLLDLESLDNENALISLALARLQPVRENYATAPYTESFNWPEVLNELKQLVDKSGRPFKETSFYIVAFRSQIKPSTDYSHLGELDKAAHAEAIASGGFLKYVCGLSNLVPNCCLPCLLIAGTGLDHLMLS
jgi:hypothetical protein